MSNSTCSIDGCERVHFGKSLCHMHYMRKRRHGHAGTAEPIDRVPRGGECKFPECEKFSTNAGFCSMHYSRKMRNGDPSIRTLSIHPNRWVGDDIGYQSAHARIKHMRGVASLNSCVDCGLRASDWSYNHDDPNEKVEHGLSANPVAYSSDPAHYSPRCRPCHRKFDSSQKEVSHV